MTDEDVAFLRDRIDALLGELNDGVDDVLKILLRTLFGSLKTVLKQHPYVEPQEIFERAVFAYTALEGKYPNTDQPSYGQKTTAKLSSAFAILAGILAVYVAVPQVPSATKDFWLPFFQASVEGLRSFDEYVAHRLKLPSEERPALPAPPKALAPPRTEEQEEDAQKPD